MAQQNNGNDLEKLYKAVSEKFNIGDYDSFLSKMQTTEDRLRFYNAVREKGYNLGDYNDYESRLGKSLEVPAVGSVDTSVESVEPTSPTEVSPSAPTESSPTQNVTSSEQSLTGDQFLGALNKRNRDIAGLTGLEDVLSRQTEVVIPEGTEIIPNAVGPDGLPVYAKLNEDGTYTQGGNILAPIDLAPTLKDIEEQQKPTPWQSVKNSISNIGNQLQGFDDRLTIFTTDVYEKVFGKDLGGKIYAFLDDGIITGLPGQDGDKEGLLRRRREEAYEELRRLGEEALPTLGITDSFNSGRIENLAAGIVNAVSAVAGTAIVSVPTGGAGLFTEMGGGFLYDYNTAKAESKGITTKELIDSGEADFWTPFTISLIGGGLERAGFSGITKSIMRNLSGSAAKKAVVLGLDWNKEASTEWVQGGLEAYNKAIAQGGTHEQAIEAMSSRMASEEGLEEYLMGLFGSAGATGMGRLSKGVINKASKDKIRKNADEIQTMVSDMSKTTDPSTRSSLLEVISEKANEILSAKQESNEIESQLTDEQKTEVNELTSIIDSIDDGLANSELSDVSTEALNARKAELEKQVDKIITTREPSTDIAPEAVDKRIQDFRDNNPNVELDDPMDSIPESVENIMSRIDDNLPVDPVSAKETSDTLYAKYKELSDMKKDPNRTLTIAEIDGYMEQLESDIETLENYTTEGTPVQEQTQENETTETEIQPETTQEVSEVSLESSEVAPVGEATGQTQELVNEPSPVKPVIETTREPRSSETAMPRQDMPPNNQDNPRLKSLIRVLPRQDTAEMRGPANVEYRRDVIESITGERPAKKDAGITNVRGAIADYLGIDLENTSGVDFADMVRNWANSPDSSPKKSSAQQPVAQAQSSGTQLDPNTVSIPVSDITTDEASFQNRESLDTERVDNIVNNFNEVKFDPIVVYNDDGKMVVLSGHHRFAAAQRMGMKNIPSREFKGTREEAIEFARDSNTLSRPETSIERASRYRDMRSKGESENSIREKARIAHGSEATKILNLSRLSENGKAMEAIRSFQDSTDTDTRNKVEAIGDWIGNVKSRHPDLSTRQENEMFDYLMEKYGTKKKSGAITNRSQFFDIANALVDRLKNRGDFNPESVLNFNNAAGKSGIEIEYDETLAEAKENVAKARKALDDARARAVSEGMNPDRMNKVLAPLEDNLRNAIADEQAVRAQKGQLQEAVRAQTSIFDIINQNEEQIESNATVEREVQSAFNGEPTENTEASRSDQEVRQESPTGDQSEESNRSVKSGTPQLGESRRDRAGRSDSGQTEKLEGAPNVKGATGPDPALNEVARKYAQSIGIDFNRQTEYVEVDVDRAERIAKAYEEMEHVPSDPVVKEAYENLIRQTRAQYDALSEAGYVFYFYDETNDPYNGSPWEAMRDLRGNKKMAVFATEAGYGSSATDLDVSDNPLLQDTGIEWGYGSPDGPKKRVTANDLFRAVHDAFGHGLEGAGFRARGEENAWQAHARLFTGSAIGALTTETRGQNSWLNFGPYGEQNRNAKVEDTIFADQKTGLMPEWTWKEGFDGIQYDTPSVSTSEKKDSSRSKTAKPRTPKTLLKGVADRLSKTGLAKSVTIKNSQEISEDLSRRGNTQSSGGDVRGYVDPEGNIVINSDTAGLDNPIHEFAHVWERTIEKTNPLLHAQGMELIAGPDGKPYVDHVRQTQPGLEGRELYKEALAQAIGDRGARLIESQKEGPIKEWLKKAWEFIGNLVGISSMSSSEIAGLTLEQYADAAAVDLLKGKPIAKLPSGDIAIETAARTESEMDDADKFMADFVSRMKQKNGVNFQGNVSGGLSTDDFKDLTRYFRYAIEKGQISTLSDARLIAKSMGISSPADVDMAFKLAKTRGSGAVGFKKSEVSEETIANTDFAKMTDEEYRDMGRSLVEQGLVNPNTLVAEIIETPRALQPWEVTALQYYRSNIESEMVDISSKLDSNDANYTYRVGGETLTGYKAMAQRMAFINEALFDLEVAMLTTANQQSAAFRLRSVMADKDFNIVQFLAEMKARGAIDPDLEQKLINLSNELNVVRAKLKEKSKEVDELQERIAVENINYTAQQRTRTRRVKPKKEVLATIEMTLDTIDPSAFGLPGMSFQANNTILFQTNPNPSLSDAVANAVAKMRSNISEGTMNIADAIEQAVADVDAVVGKGNWDSMKFKSEIANKLVGQGVAVQMKAPYVNTDGRLIVPGAYITSIAREGADTLDKMVQRVNDDLGGRFSEYDIRNAISGYGRQTAKTRTDLDRAISKAKRIAKLLSEIEDLESKGQRLKTRKQVDNNDAEIEALKLQVKRLEYNLEMTPEERSQLAEQKYNENRRKYLRSYIDNLQERIKNKDFAPKNRKNQYEEDSETQKLRVEAERIKNEFKKEKYRHELETRSFEEKLKSYSYELVFNTTRAATAGMDASAMGVQGSIYAASRPLEAYRVFKDSMKGSFSEAEYESYFAELQADPLYEVARKAELALQLPSFYQSVQEEQFKGSLPAYALDYLTGSAGEMVAKMRGGDVVKARQFAQDKFNFAKIADRNYSLVLSKIRMDLFREFLTNQVNKRGLDVELDTKEVAEIAEAVNTITMASKVPGVEGKVANDITSMIMFSARKFVATWKILGAWIPLAINNRQLLKDAYGGVIARGLGTLFTMAALPNIMGTLMAAYGDEDDEEDNYWYNKHWLNPKHSDFLKIRLGNTRISLFNGIDGNIIFATRFLSGEYMTSSSEAVKELGGASNNKTPGRLSWEYISNKFAPTTSIITNRFLYSDREKQESYERFKESFAPMWVTGIYDQYVKTGNVGETIALGAAGFFGLAYNNYGGAEFAKGPGSDNIKVRSIFDKSGLTVYDPGNGVRKYFNGESESAVKGKNYKDVYLPAYQEFMREAVLSHEKNLSPDKHWEYKEGLVNKFKKEAYKHAELELSGVVFTSAFKDVSYDGQKYVIPKSLYKLKADYIKQYMDEYSRDLALYKEDMKYEFLEREGVKPTDRYLEMLAKNELYKEAQREANQRMIDDMEMGKIKLIPKDEYVSSEDNFEDE